MGKKIWVEFFRVGDAYEGASNYSRDAFDHVEDIQAYIRQVIRFGVYGGRLLHKDKISFISEEITRSFLEFFKCKGRKVKLILHPQLEYGNYDLPYMVTIAKTNLNNIHHRFKGVCIDYVIGYAIDSNGDFDQVCPLFGD